MTQALDTTKDLDDCTKLGRGAETYNQPLARSGLPENLGNTYNLNMPPKDDERMELRAPPENVKRWRATAGAEGLLLSEWIRRTLDAAALDQETLDTILAKSRERQLRLQRERMAENQRRQAEVDAHNAAVDAKLAGSVIPVVTAPSVEKRTQNEARREQSKRKLANDLAAAAERSSTKKKGGK
jgi:hypothetical protein